MCWCVRCYRVTLTPQERQELQALTRTGKTSGKRFLYARALLLCDNGPDGPGWTVARTAEAMGVTARTVEHLKRRFVEEGLTAALQRKQRQRPPREVTFDGEPLTGRRHVEAGQRRTRRDWARWIQGMLRTRYPQAERVVLILDNLNTHGIESLYETFAPQEARSLAERLEIHYTPKHGSWLKMAE